MKGIKETKFISTRTKKSILFVVNIILLVALIVIATFAWFLRNLVDEVNTDEVLFEGNSDLQVSLDGTDYGYKKMIDTGGKIYNEITGTGIISSLYSAPTTGYKTNSTTNSTTLVPTDTGTWEVANSGDYIKQKIYFRSEEELTVYLGSGSWVKGSDEINGKKLVSENSSDVGHPSDVEVKNSDGTKVTMSKDCIVGATRVAFISGESATNPNFIWIPRANIFYETTETSKKIYGGTTYDSANLDSSSGSQPFPDPTKHYYGTNGSSVISKFDNVIAGSSNLVKSQGNESCKVVKLEKPNAESKYYEGNATVVIWVEGCDAEARRAFAGGKFGVYFQFLGF